MIKSNSGTETKQFNGERCTFQMPICNSIAINAIRGVSDGIDTVAEFDWTWQRHGDMLTLTGVPAGTSVLLYDMRGILLRSVTSDGSEITLPVNAGNLHVLRVGDKTIKL